MDRKEKQEKKQNISQYVDLANGRYTDDEIDRLIDLVNNRNKYNGKSKTIKNSYDSWSSDGKYTRDEETTYIFQNKPDGICIKEDYQFFDDDGHSGKTETEHRSAREILKLSKVLL